METSRATISWPVATAMRKSPRLQSGASGPIDADRNTNSDTFFYNDKTQGGGATPDYLYANDTDGDGISDGVEDADHNGSVGAGETDPTQIDSDGDGIPDGIEDKNKNGIVDSNESSMA